MFIFQALCAFSKFKKTLTFFIAGLKLGNGFQNNFQTTILEILAPLFYKYKMIWCRVCFLYLIIKHQPKPMNPETSTQFTAEWTENLIITSLLHRSRMQVCAQTSLIKRLCSHPVIEYQKEAAPMITGPEVLVWIVSPRLTPIQLLKLAHVA